MHLSIESENSVVSVIFSKNLLRYFVKSYMNLDSMSIIRLYLFFLVTENMLPFLPRFLFVYDLLYVLSQYLYAIAHNKEA